MSYNDRKHGGNWNKRPYSNSSQSNNWRSNAPRQQQGSIGPGLCGLFFTTEDERRSIPEAKNLIDRFLTKQIDEKDQNASGSKTTEQTEDIADSLESACHQIKQEHAKRSGILRQLDTQARCTLFFVSPDITPDNVNGLAEQMVKFCQEEPHCRFLAKVYPIEETVPAYMDQIIPALSALIEKHLVKHSEESTNPPTYAIDFKARNTKLIEKLKVYDEVTALMKEKSAGCSVNLTKPDLLILVHAIRTTAFLAIIHKYDEYRKYALRKPTEGQEKGAAAEGGTSSTTQNDEESEEKKEQEEEEG